MESTGFDREPARPSMADEAGGVMRAHPFWLFANADLDVDVALIMPLNGPYKGQLALQVVAGDGNWCLRLSDADLARMAAGVQAAYAVRALGTDMLPPPAAAHVSDCRHERVGARCSKCGVRL